MRHSKYFTTLRKYRVHIEIGCVVCQPNVVVFGFGHQNLGDDVMVTSRFIGEFALWQSKIEGLMAV